MSRLIDADALKKDLDAWVRVINKPKYYVREEALYIIDAMPTVEPKRGEWKKGKEFQSYPRVKFISDAYYCSVCENEAFYDTDYGQQLFNFCPNCGADMRKNEKE